MRPRRLLPLVAFATLAARAAWLNWGGPARTAQAAPTVPADDTVSGMSAAEFRFRNSQSTHWRAYMLKRPMDR
jgi:hypothetical protein